MNLPRTAARPLGAIRNPSAIETERERLFAEMKQLSELNGNSARAIETARVLLTRWWSKASWRKREQLISAADWLIRLEHNHGAQPHA